MALVSKLYCFSSQTTVLIVRKRPHVVNGGGFVVTDCSHKVVFKAEGCGVLGIKGELLLRDGYGNPLLLIRRKGAGMVEALLSIYRTWKGYKYDYEGSEKLVFSFKEPNSFLVRKEKVMRISAVEERVSNNDNNKNSSSSVKNLEFEIKGYFPDRKCSIVDSMGNVVAQIGANKEGGEVKNDVYEVMVKPEMDQAFVCGVIAILDNIYHESTRC